MRAVKTCADSGHWLQTRVKISLGIIGVMHLINLKTLDLPLNDVLLKGDISIPQNAHSLVIFAHGSGSSRLSPRNQLVSAYLNEHGIATFLFDLLTYNEDRNFENRFNIPLLAQRLKEATSWIEQQNDYSAFRMGYFGASTGAAAALIATSELLQIAAVVSRGGRPDLAMKEIPTVKAPTLFIVGQLDEQVLKLNERAFQLLNCDKKLEVIPGATHLFEEEGAMDKVCVSAANWFEMHMQPLELFG